MNPYKFSVAGPASSRSGPSTWLQLFLSLGKRRYAPFVQSLFGSVHGFGSYFPVSSGSTGAASSFAGGGLNIRMKHWLAIRPVQLDSFLTRLPNGSDNRQNNLRLSAGVVFRLR